MMIRVYKMIYTCTVNPSLDYYLTVDKEIKLGELNRLKSEGYAAGGKGVNVSIALNNLEMTSTALGFLGGFTREFYLSFLKEYHHVLPLFTAIEGNTRINIKLRGIKETNLNAHGPHIRTDEFNRFLVRINHIDSPDIFVLCGNVQDDIHMEMINVLKDLSSRNVKLIVDTDPRLMRASLQFKPLLIKPELSEFEELCGKIITNTDELLAESKKLVEAGAQNVIVSLGADGAFLINEEGAYRYESKDYQVVSLSGNGDAMVGAYVFNLQRGANAMEAFQYACAAAEASMKNGEYATRDQINEIYDKIKIERI